VPREDPKELGRLAQQLAETSDPDEAARLKERLRRGFYDKEGELPKFTEWQQPAHELFQLGNEHANIVACPGLQYREFTPEQMKAISDAITVALVSVTRALTGDE
jgi:hypothetical protein